MGTIGIILLVVFVIASLLLIGIVLIQSEEGGGMGGLLGGGGTSTFGSRSQTVITKTTYVLVTLFFVLSFTLAFINKTPSVSNLEAAVQQVSATATEDSQSWIDADEGVQEIAPVEAKPAEVASDNLEDLAQQSND
ncbi:MAG TPA: preprotein translocase subunit SecG [Treponemataceae bacterium]|nr:preprotein translocase subunit SecG [Treponemataceae bacterium]